MATVSVSYLWIALEVRGAQERAAGEAFMHMLPAGVSREADGDIRGGEFFFFAPPTCSPGVRCIARARARARSRPCPVGEYE